MGQQQLLLIMLSVIVVGVAIAMGIVIFSTNAIEQKRNEVINECILLASDAQLFFRKPVAMGGGGKSFSGWNLPPQYITTEAGSFTRVLVSNQEVKITGTGNEIATDGDLIKVEITVTPNEYSTSVIN